MPALVSPTKGTLSDLLQVNLCLHYLGFYLLFFTLLCFIFMVCSLRTSVAFVSVFFTATVALACLVGVYFHAAKGSPETAKTLTVVSSHKPAI
jgi:succinate-acetate transporter protein